MAEKQEPGVKFGINAIDRKLKGGDYVTFVGTAEKTEDGKHYIIDVMPCAEGGLIQVLVSAVEIKPLRTEKCSDGEEVELQSIRVKKDTPALLLEPTIISDATLQKLKCCSLGTSLAAPVVAMPMQTVYFINKRPERSDCEIWDDNSVPPRILYCSGTLEVDQGMYCNIPDSRCRYRTKPAGSAVWPGGGGTTGTWIPSNRIVEMR